MDRDHRMRTSLIAISISIFIIIISFSLPYFAPYDPSIWGKVPRDLPPSPNYLFGTTSTGQDMFWYTFLALKNTIIIGAIASAIAVVIAFMLGTIAGIVRSYIANALFTILIDSFCALPIFPILVVILYSWRHYLNLAITAGILGCFLWMWPGRAARAMVFSLRERTFTYTALLSGYGIIKIVLSEYLPYMLRWLISNYIISFIAATGMEVALSILGVFPITIPSIGIILYWASQYQAILRGLWWWLVFPILFYSILIISLYIGLRSIEKMIGISIGE